MNIHEAYNKFSVHYDEPHRYYHNRTHLDSMLDDPACGSIAMQYFCLFHDIIYNPRANDNEQLSALTFLSNCDDFQDLRVEDHSKIINAITSTRGLEQDIKLLGDPFVNQAYQLDRAILRKPLAERLVWEEGIFKEYQFVSVNQYRQKRLEFLAQQGGSQHDLMEIVKSKTYRVGYYAGSFNPFHIGHLNVLRKAEKVFDKVILVRADNPEKVDPLWSNMPISLPNEIIEHEGLITELFKPEPLVKKTLIRGIRNEYDVAAEMNYQAWVKEFDPSVDFSYFFCDPEHTKVSSSQLRSLQKLAPEKVEEFIIP